MHKNEEKFRQEKFFQSKIEMKTVDNLISFLLFPWLKRQVLLLDEFIYNKRGENDLEQRETTFQLNENIF